MRLRTIIVTGGGGLLLTAALLAAACVAGVQQMIGSLPGSLLPTSTAFAQIPTGYLLLYQQAAATCPGLPWTVLAGVGAVETDHGRATATSSAGAMGPMQFLPATWRAYGVDGDQDGRIDIDDPADAIFTAARYLCAHGARDGRHLDAAVYAYNHAHWYVDEVLAIALSYGQPLASAPSPATAAALRYALDQLGVPYRWGGDSPAGFDCSGLTQAAYAAAGVTIPRTSEAQWTALPHVPTDALRPGDLVFFDPGEFQAGLPGHVGLYLGDGTYIDAPHTGATVRVDRLAAAPPLFGAARPGSPTITAAGPNHAT